MIQPSLNRRNAVALSFATLAGLSFSACSPKKPTPSSSVAENKISAVLRTLPNIEPATGRKAAAAIIPGAEKLLIVVRLAHVNEEKIRNVGPETKSVLFKALPQTDLILRAIARSINDASLSGDGLLSETANSINRDIARLRDLKARFQSLTRFQSADEIASYCASTLATTSPADPSYGAVDQLQKDLLRQFEAFDKGLKEYHSLNASLVQRVRIEPIVRMAIDSRLTLSGLEDKNLHAEALKMAKEGGDEALFFALNERREEAILNAVANSKSAVTILTMGPAHRFKENAERRSLLPVKERVSVVEFSPAALPEDLQELAVVMSR
jgi:hypothetical protein